MRKIMILVTCVLAVLMISTSGLAEEDKEKVKPVKIEIETESGKKIKFYFDGYEANGDPIFRDKQNGNKITPVIDQPEGTDQLIGVLDKNPCYACARGRCVVVLCR